MTNIVQSPALTRFWRKRVGGGTRAPEKLRHNTWGSRVNANVTLWGTKSGNSWGFAIIDKKMEMWTSLSYLFPFNVLSSKCPFCLSSHLCCRASWALHNVHHIMSCIMMLLNIHCIMIHCICPRTILRFLRVSSWFVSGCGMVWSFIKLDVHDVFKWHLLLMNWFAECFFLPIFLRLNLITFISVSLFHTLRVLISLFVAYIIISLHSEILIIHLY